MSDNRNKRQQQAQAVLAALHEMCPAAFVPAAGRKGKPKSRRRRRSRLPTQGG